MRKASVKLGVCATFKLWLAVGESRVVLQTWRMLAEVCTSNRLPF